MTLPGNAPGDGPDGADTRIAGGARIPRISRILRVLRDGGVIAYPNESVYGLGCLPDRKDAVERILALKGRPRSMGVILIAAEWAQFDGWAGELKAMPRGSARGGRIPPSTPRRGAGELEAMPRGRELLRSRGVTWVVTAAPGVPDWITGARPTIAIRRSLHPLACALSRAANSPLVSTSCNPHGKPPARSAKAARDYFGDSIDWVLDGQCGPLEGPTEIRDAATGEVLRPGASTSAGEVAEAAAAPRSGASSGWRGSPGASASAGEAAEIASGSKGTRP